MAQKVGTNFIVTADEIIDLIDGRGVDTAIEPLGVQQTFESSLRRHRSGRTLSTLDVSSDDHKILLNSFHAGLYDNRPVTLLCPSGKERMRRLMNMISLGRIDLKPLMTHCFMLEQIGDLRAFCKLAKRHPGKLP